MLIAKPRATTIKPAPKNLYFFKVPFLIYEKKIITSISEIASEPVTNHVLINVCFFNEIRDKEINENLLLMWAPIAEQWQPGQSLHNMHTKG